MISVWVWHFLCTLVTKLHDNGSWEGIPPYNWSTVSGNLAGLSNCCCLRLILYSQRLYKEFIDAVFLVLGRSDKSHCRVKRQESSLTQETASTGSYWLPLDLKDPPFWTRNLTSGKGHVEKREMDSGWWTYTVHGEHSIIYSVILYLCINVCKTRIRYPFTRSRLHQLLLSSNFIS